MHRLTFKPTGRRAGCSLEIGEDYFPAPESGRPTLFWSVVHDDDTQVRLANGKSLTNLPGTVHVSIGDAGPKTDEGVEAGPRWGLHLFTARDDDSQDYIIDMRVSATLFQRLEQLVIAGQVPDLKVSIEDVESFKPEHVWDFERLKWDNKATDRLVIKACRFELDLGRDECPIPESAPQAYGLAPPKEVDLLELGKTITKEADRTERATNKILVPLWIIAAVIAYLVLRRYL